MGNPWPNSITDERIRFLEAVLAKTRQENARLKSKLHTMENIAVNNDWDREYQDGDGTVGATMFRLIYDALWHDVVLPSAITKEER